MNIGYKIGFSNVSRWRHPAVKKCILRYVSATLTGVINTENDHSTANLGQNTESVFDTLKIRLQRHNNGLIVKTFSGNALYFNASPASISNSARSLSNYKHSHLGTIATSAGVMKIYRFPQEKHLVNANAIHALQPIQSIIDHVVSLSCERPVSLLGQTPSELFHEIQSINANPSNISDDPPLTCQDTSVLPPVGFEEPSDANYIRIDLRPADCFSFFTAFPAILRGTAIEQALAQYEPYIGSQSGGNSFPVADYWHNGSVYVINSRDLTGEAIFEKLIKPLEESGAISHNELGTHTVLHAADVQQIYLDVVVQFGVMTDAQREQLSRAADELLARFGIILRILEIP